MKGSRETRFPFLLYPHRLLSVLEVVLEVLGGGAVLRYAQRRGGRQSVGSLLYFLCCVRVPFGSAEVVLVAHRRAFPCEVVSTPKLCSEAVDDHSLIAVFQP